MVLQAPRGHAHASGLAAVVVRGPAIGGGGAGKAGRGGLSGKSLLEVRGGGDAASFSSRGPVAFS